MAVKYSKQVDFGARGRKSRKIGKKMWTKKSTHRLKSLAKKRASALRKRGYSARVVKLTRGYGVYSHTK
tara:strand:+ start:1136 stop:1342 length:207 start_codon:yes stop_codon:yes gene_type:complete